MKETKPILHSISQQTTEQKASWLNPAWRYKKAEQHADTNDLRRRMHQRMLAAGWEIPKP